MYNDKTKNKMKTKTTFIATLLFLGAMSFATVKSHAQGDPAIKILPTSQRGVLKVLYAYPNAKPVFIEFADNSGVLVNDKIKKAYTKGFSKKYDLNNLQPGNYWVTITSPEVTVTYKLSRSKETKWVSTLEKATYKEPLVATNN
jgi:hypothetical protein